MMLILFSFLYITLPSLPFLHIAPSTSTSYWFGPAYVCARMYVYIMWAFLLVLICAYISAYARRWIPHNAYEEMCMTPSICLPLLVTIAPCIPPVPLGDHSKFIDPMHPLTFHRLCHCEFGFSQKKWATVYLLQGDTHILVYGITCRQQTNERRDLFERKKLDQRTVRKPKCQTWTFCLV